MTDHEPIHLLLYGFSGSKKTSMAATFPTPGYVAMFDAYGQDSPFLRAGDKVEKAKSKSGVPIKRVWHKKDLLFEVHYYYDEDEENPDAWHLFREEQQLFDHTQWATWVCDSLTEAAEAAKFEQLRINPKGNMMQIMGGVTDQLSLHLKTRLKKYDCNVVVICHVAQKFVNVPSFQKGVPATRVDKRIESSEANEDGNIQLVRGLSAPGRLARDGGLMSQFAEVYRTYVVTDEKGKRRYCLQTQNDGEFVAKTAQINAPDGCEPTYQAIWGE